MDDTLPAFRWEAVQVVLRGAGELARLDARVKWRGTVPRRVLACTADPAVGQDLRLLAVQGGTNVLRPLDGRSVLRLERAPLPQVALVVPDRLDPLRHALPDLGFG